MKLLLQVVPLVFVSVAAGAALAQAELSDPQVIADRASAAAYYRGADGKATVSMTIEDARGRTRNREFTILRTDVEDEDNGDQRFYVLFARPSDVKGTSFLVWKHTDRDDDRWLYLPALDLVKRIAASDERTSFVGSHFYYEDISGRSPTEDTHVLIETTDDYYVLESTPRDADAVEFSKYRTYIHRESFIPVKSEYLDDQGEVFRTYRATGVETIEGNPTVTRSEISDERTGGKTTLEFSEIDYDAEIPANVFSERYLRNPPRRYLR